MSPVGRAPSAPVNRRTWLVAGAAAALAGCAGGPPVDTRYRSVSQGPRVDLLVIHYTALDFETSLRVLTRQV